jgi:tetratricopeptide (TPR) repeat protein
MKTKFLFWLLLLCFPLHLAFGQSNENCENGWCWGNDPGTAKEKWTLFSDDFKMKNYKEAVNTFEWCLANVPDLNKALYIRGVDLYEQLLDAEEKGGKDAQKIMAYQDKILTLFDQRIKYYGEEADVLERKGKKAYFFLKDRTDPNKWKTMYDLYNRIFELNAKETTGSSLTFLMLSMVNLKAQKKMTEEEVLSKYDEISEVLDYNINIRKGRQSERWDDIQSSIDGLLAKAVPVGCDFVRSKMAETIRNKPEDLKSSKRAIKYMLNDKCVDDPLFLIAAQNVFKQEPTLGLASTIAKLYQQNKDYDKAMQWKEKAIGLATEQPEEQAKLHFEIAQILYVQGKKPEARTRAQKAIEADANVASDAYTLIGDLYYTSGSQCTDSNPVKARAVYMAAFDMYQKAGNSTKMAQAREQFPSVTDLFQLAMQEGQPISVGCWIGVTTTLRSRPKDN